MFRNVIPTEIEPSDVNERDWSRDDEDQEDWEEFVENIRQNGIAQPPVVRTLDGGGYEVIIGQRRVEAAKEAGLDQIEVITRDWDDGDALARSISENVPSFKKDVSARDRAIALRQLAELSYEGEGDPPQQWYCEQLGVSQPTISRWLGPLDDDWRDTVIDPRNEEGSDISVEELRDLGGRKLNSIKKTTGGGEEGEWLAHKTVEEGFTIQDLAEIRRNVDEGRSVENAVGVFTGELTEEEVETDPEPMEEEEEPEEEEEKTSTAELGQNISAYADDSTESETSSPDTPESTDSPSIEEDDEEENEDEEEQFTYKGRTADELVASEEAIKEMQRNSDSWTDDLEPVEEEEEEYPDVAEFPAFTIEGDVAVGAYQAAEDIGAEGDMEELARCAIDWFVREAEYV